MRQLRHQQRRSRTGHVDDWLMTYADMITLLLCFFAIFLSVSIRKQRTEHRPPAIKVRSEAPRITTNNVSSETDGAPSASLQEIAKRLQSQGPSSIQEEGDRITTLQMSSGALFASGSAALSDSGRTILKDVAINIDSDRYKDYQVTVEGHTDDTPINTIQFPSNWELSTARAAAVVQFFLQLGIPAQRLRAAGYADTYPVAPNRDAEGKSIPENQAKNRRVVIKLEKIEKQDGDTANAAVPSE